MTFDINIAYIPNQKKTYYIKFVCSRNKLLAV